MFPHNAGQTEGAGGRGWGPLDKRKSEGSQLISFYTPLPDGDDPRRVLENKRKRRKEKGRKERKDTVEEEG